MIDIDLIIFDMDGVLVDTTPCHSRAFDELWSAIGIVGPTYDAIAGRRSIEVVEEYTRPLAPARSQVIEWAEHKQLLAREYLLSEDILFDDIPESLDLLKKAQIPMALGTGASGKTADAILERFEWKEMFSPVVTGENVSLGKPAPDVFRMAIELAGGVPSRTLVIEDSLAGLRAALDSGAYAAIVRSGITSTDDHFLGSFPDLSQLIYGLKLINS